MKHASFSPSKAPRWVNCTASYYVNEAQEKETGGTIYSHEGTLAHMIASKVLKDETKLESFIGYTEPYSEDEIVFDREKIYFIQDYIDIVMSYARKGKLFVEEKVRADEDIRGTLDARVIVGNTMHIFDLKFGIGETVDIEENEQMLCYAEGALNEVDPLEDQIKQLVLHIVQPRRMDGNTHTMWEISVKDFEPHMKRIYEAKEQIKKGHEHTKFKAGEKQCRWCAFKEQCQAYRDYALGVAQLRFAEFVEKPTQAIGEALGLTDARFKPLDDEVLFEMIEKKKFAVLRLWIETMEKYALERAIERRKAGEDIGELKIVGSVKHRKWQDEKKVLKYIGTVLEKLPDKFKEEEFFTEPKLRSPAQLEKGPLRKLPEGARKKFEAQIFKPQGEPRLVLKSDNRAELPIDAETVFKSYATGSEGD